VANDKRLEKALTPDDLITLYLCMVQYKWWRGLIRDYKYKFNTDLIREHKKFGGDLQSKF
jgi:hypothetical protein